MKSNKETAGPLVEFDDFVSIVLEDVPEFETTPEGSMTKLNPTLLNGNDITMLVSGEGSEV
ncbi:U6 snRNA-associated Sm-like protein LSm5 [Nycticebus coucang]|uniref:U6 snRNA-associated Sm-like protein LSm5 n=1 Tax=Nycticebus coucang TaxID=9470 RepID=UPI00234C5523|nr:U6 snRNA-associated Sm-like protein LSm5 [Nycticebus coucang]